MEIMRIQISENEEKMEKRERFVGNDEIMIGKEN